MYDQDEYYEDYEDFEDFEAGGWRWGSGFVDATLFSSHLCKAPNGHLYVEEVQGWKYSGQDWGETVGQWVTTRLRISELAEELRPVAIRIGRDLKPGEQLRCYLWDELDDDDDLLDDGVYTGDQVKHQPDDDLPDFPF